MKQLLLIPFLFICTVHSFAQQGPLESMMKQGIALHDKGDYEAAIRKYDKVIAKDSSFYLAYYEKSFSLYTAGKYQVCIDWCITTLDKFPEGNENRNIYANYGSCLDALGKQEEAIRIYKEGIRKYPDSYLLPYNKGLVEYARKSYDTAVADAEQALRLNPLHTSSHLLLAYSIYKMNKMAALLALSTFLIEEPESKRARETLPALLQILGNGVRVKDDKTVSISLERTAVDTSMVGEDNFHQAELMIALRSGLDYGDKYKDRPTALNIQDKLTLLIELPVRQGGKKSGFFTGFYVPFFEEMKKNEFLETACYILYSPSGDAVTKKWLQDNANKVDAFNTWLHSYTWLKEVLDK